MKIKRDGITYTLSPKTLTGVVSNCDEKKEGKVVLPTQVEYKGKTYAVTEIGEYAFCGCSKMQSIIIPDGVQSIENGAFCGCDGLTDVFISKSVTHIGERAFYVYDIGFGDNGILEEETFSHLSTIVVESGNPTYDSRNNCNAIIETITNTLLVGSEKTIIPNDILIISERAFRGCIGLVSIDIPGRVREIQELAFANCSNLSSVTLHNGTKSIGKYAFFECTRLKNKKHLHSQYIQKNRKGGLYDDVPYFSEEAEYDM